jgi:hypothetical protein
MGKPSSTKSDSSTGSDNYSSIESPDVNKNFPFPFTLSQPSVPGTDGSGKMSPPSSPGDRRTRPTMSLTSDNPKTPWYKRMLEMNSIVNLKEPATHLTANDQLPPPRNLNMSASDCTEDHPHDIVSKTTPSEMVRADAVVTTDFCPSVTESPKSPTATPAHTFNHSPPLTKDDGNPNAEIMEAGPSNLAPTLVFPMNTAVRIEQSANLRVITIVPSLEPATSSEETNDSSDDVTMPTKEDEQTQAEIAQAGTSHPTPLPASSANNAFQTQQTASPHTVSIIPSSESVKSSDELKDNKPTQSKYVTFHPTSLPPASVSNHSVQLEQSACPSATSDPVKGSGETSDSFQEPTSSRKVEKFEFRFEDMMLSEIYNEESDQYDDMMGQPRGERLKYVLRLVPKVYPPSKDISKPGFNLQNVYRNTYGPKIILRGDIEAPVPEWIFIEGICLFESANYRSKSASQSPQILG